MNIGRSVIILIFLVPGLTAGQQLLGSFTYKKDVKDFRSYPFGDSTICSFLINPNNGKSINLCVHANGAVHASGVNTLNSKMELADEMLVCGSDVYKYKMVRDVNHIASLMITRNENWSEEKIIHYGGEAVGLFKLNNLMLISYDRHAGLLRVIEIEKDRMKAINTFRLPDLKYGMGEFKFIPYHKFLSPDAGSERVKVYYENRHVYLTVDTNRLDEKELSYSAGTLIFDCNLMNDSLTRRIVPEPTGRSFRSFLYGGNLYRFYLDKNMFELAIYDSLGSWRGGLKHPPDNSVREEIFYRDLANTYDSASLKVMLKWPDGDPTIIVEDGKPGETCVSIGHTYLANKGFVFFSKDPAVMLASTLLAIANSLPRPNRTKYFYLSCDAAGSFSVRQDYESVPRVKVDNYEIEHNDRKYILRAYSQVGKKTLGIYFSPHNEVVDIVSYDLSNE